MKNILFLIRTKDYGAMTLNSKSLGRINHDRTLKVCWVQEV